MYLSRMTGQKVCLSSVAIVSTVNEKNIMSFVVVTMWKFPDLMLLQLYVLWRLICSLGHFFFCNLSHFINFQLGRVSSKPV